MDKFICFSNKKKLLQALNFITTVFMGLFIIIFVNFYPQDLYSIAIISTFMYFVLFGSWFVQCKEKINFYSIFLLFTYFFYFGQFFVLLLGGPLDFGITIVSGILPYEVLIKTGSFIISYMIILHVGVLFSTFDVNNYKNVNGNNKKSKSYMLKINNNLKRTGLFLFFASIVPSLIILCENIIIMAKFGYGAIFQSTRYTSGGFNNILRFLSTFTIPSFLILLITYKGDRKLKYIKLTLFIYLLLYFLSGSRLNGVLLLASLLLIRNYWYRKISTKEILRIIVLSIAGMTFLSLISAVRDNVHIIV